MNKPLYLFEQDIDHVEALLEEYHPAEVARLADLTEPYAHKIVHYIYTQRWKLTGWEPEYLDRNHWGIFSKGTEYINEDGEYLCFETEAQARDYINERLKEIA